MDAVERGILLEDLYKKKMKEKLSQKEPVASIEIPQGNEEDIKRKYLQQLANKERYI